MKKNRMMRLASTLLVLTLLSTCAISGTFAKYVTTDTAKDSARVAKWGVTLQVDGSLYGMNYSDFQDNKPTVSTTDDDISIESSDASKVLAPGSQSDKGFHFALTGTPEVRVQVDSTIEVQNVYLSAGTYAHMVKVTVNEVDYLDEVNSTTGLYTFDGNVYTKVNNSEKYDASGDYYKIAESVTLNATYYPVVYTLAAAEGDVSYSGGSTSVDTINVLATELTKTIKGDDLTDNIDKVEKGVTTIYEVVNTHAPNTNLATALEISNSTITWVWNINGNDAADTILGLLADNDNDSSTDTDTVGKVVKLDTDSTSATYNSYVAVEAGDATNLNDYNLTTSFKIRIKATQVD